jgi:hypothetical protein
MDQILGIGGLQDTLPGAAIKRMHEIVALALAFPVPPAP